MAAASGCRAFSPLPGGRHLNLGYGLAPVPDLEPIQREGAGPVRIHPATHMADLVGSALQRANPATDERGHHVVTLKPLRLELGDSFQDEFELRVPVTRIVPQLSFVGGPMTKAGNPMRFCSVVFRT